MTKDNRDWYIENVVEKGDQGSELLAAICAPTLKNSEYVDVIKKGMNGLAVLRIPKDHHCVVHSVGGDPEQSDPAKHAASLVDRLVQQAELFDAIPVGFADVIDANTPDKELILAMGNSLVKKANEYKLPILNGELAVLGKRVKDLANGSGTMISIKRTTDLVQNWNIINYKGVNYAVFDPQGKAVLINSDGVGTKTEFYERAGTHHLAIEDFMAMNLDDASKIGAIPKVISGVVEMKGKIPFEKIQEHIRKTAKEMDILGILQPEFVADRIRGYNEQASSYNISGSVVSVIDEERLKNPLKPSPGEYIIAIRKNQNPRSNGITDKRKIMIQELGQDWHTTHIGKIFLEYLSTPSTILYPIFKDLIDKGLATSVYHMSGGAFKGKLAKPLAEHNLFVKLNLLFQPDIRERLFIDASNATTETAYGKWPMANDGFITTKNPDESIGLIQSQGFEARLMSSKIEKAIDGKTGVELRAFNGEKIYYSGR